MAHMRVTVRLFAILRERAGARFIDVELPERATVADALGDPRQRAELGELLDADARADGGQPRVRRRRHASCTPATSWR